MSAALLLALVLLSAAAAGVSRVPDRSSVVLWLPCGALREQYVIPSLASAILGQKGWLLSSVLLHVSAIIGKGSRRSVPRTASRSTARAADTSLVITRSDLCKI